MVRLYFKASAKKLPAECVILLTFWLSFQLPLIGVENDRQPVSSGRGRLICRGVSAPSHWHCSAKRAKITWKVKIHLPSSQSRWLWCIREKTMSLSSAHLPEATICEMYSFLLDQHRAFASHQPYLKPWREIQLCVSPLLGWTSPSLVNGYKREQVLMMVELY